MGEPFIGSEAIAAGLLTKYDLHSRHVRLIRDVYLQRNSEVTAVVRAKAGWLWTGRRGVVAGLSAAAMHGSKWVDAQLSAEVIHTNRYPNAGVHVRGDRLADGEIGWFGDMAVTTPERTAVDLACWYPRSAAVAHIDALANATNFKLADACRILDGYRGRRGVENARVALDLVDGGAQSPKETWLRLLLIDDGLPRPRTQIPVCNEMGDAFAYLDMGWEHLMIAVEYDGEQHRTDRSRYAWDVKRQERIQRKGWINIRVLAGDRRVDILRRVHEAITTRASA
jgi:very-short-patch-repair endonuclease